MMDYPEYLKEYTIHVYETGPDGRLALSSLFDYFQDIASDHAVSLGFGRDDLMKENHIWVLSRIYAEIEQWPVWGDKIFIKTWPRGTDKLFALRDFEARFSDGKIAARATSSWLIIDYTTKRVKRPDEELSRHNYSFDERRALARNAEKLDPIGKVYSSGNPFTVKISDIDINLHTNNARYLKWVTDGYNLDFILNNVPVSAEINYLAESRLNENILINTSEREGEDCKVDHLIIRPEDKRELCRIRITWRINHSGEKH
jgi:acyl-ACP thioesterase